MSEQVESTSQLLEDLTTLPERPLIFGQTTLIIITAWCVFGVGYLAVGRTIAPAIDFLVAAAHVPIWWFGRERPESQIWLSQLMIALSLLGILAIALISGGPDSGATWYLILIPLIAGYQLGARSAIPWTLVAAGALALVHVGSSVFPWLPTEFVASGREVWAGQVVLLLIVFISAYSSRLETSRYVDHLRRRAGEVRDQADAVQSHAEQLQSARDDALQALEYRSHFLANVSHEIRTPLNGVIGMTRVLMETPMSAEQLQIVRTIDKSGKSLLAVINDILDFSKIEADEIQLENVGFDLRECIEDVLDLHSSQSFEKGLELAYELEPTVPVRLLGDVTRLRQILLNLISNAVKFTESGQITVYVRMDADRKLHFTVKDTGIGIAPDHIEHLFESFTQGDPSTTRKYGGTGLGLAISLRLAEMLGGTMWAESEVGRGSSFHFTVSMEESDAPLRTGELPEPLEGLDDCIAVVLSRPRASLDSLIAMAELWGMELYVAHDEEDLQQQLRAAGNPEFCVVFDGDWRDSTISMIRRQKPGMPIIAVASLADAGAAELAESMDFAALISRPIRYRQARQIFEAVMGGGVVDVPRSLSPFDPEMAKRVELKVLVAEDNIVNQQVVVAMLQRLGYEPDVAASGRDTLGAVQSKRYDVVFMDVHMPHMDGIEVTRRVRRFTGSRDYPWIIAMTANMQEKQKEACLAAGMNDFIGKPFEVESLIRAVEAVGKFRGFMTSSESILKRDGSWDGGKLDELRALFPNNPEKFHALVREHLTASDELVAEIKTAVNTRDASLLELKAHTFKSSAAMFGSTDVSRVAAELEELGRLSDMRRARRLYPMLERVWTAARVHLDELLAESPGSRD